MIDLVVLRRDAEGDRARAFVDRLGASGCPVGVTEAEIGSLDDLDGLLGSTPLSSVVLIWLGAEESAGVVRAIGDQLVRHGLAGLVATERARVLHEELHGMGLLAVSPDADPRSVLTVLRSLWTRQPAVEALALERRVSQMAAERMRLEVERLYVELETAAVLQRDFMPKARPEISGIEIDWLFRPAGYVSGDIYDAVVCPDGSLSFFLADAVGHGVSAALLTIAVSRALRDPALQSGPGSDVFSPGAALSELNRDICTRWRSTRWFVTAVCGRYDPETHEVTLASAGHPHPILSGVRSGGRDFAGFGGPLLGVFEDAPFDETTVTLHEGETLLLYTDGFELSFADADDTDAEGVAERDPVSEQQATAKRRFLDVLGEVGEHARELDSLGGAIGRLAERIDAESGSLHQDDDMTVLAIRRLCRQASRLAA